jgi:hypothetical protein
VNDRVDEYIVVLTSGEILAAATIGMYRNAAAMKRGLSDKHGLEDTWGWSYHIEGACGEAAFAKVMGMYWSAPINTFKRGGDVGAIEVRTRSRHDYELIVREDDSDRATFVLLTGACPRYRVHGWITGAEAKRAEWLQQHGGRESAYFVPQASLSPIWELLSAASIQL